MLILEDNDMISFKDYLLSESIKAKSTEYGINYPEFNNSEIFSINGNYSTSFIKEGLSYHCLLSSKGELGFHFTENWKEFEKDEYLNNIINLLPFDYRPKKTPGVTILSNVIYLFNILIKEANFDEIFFKPQDSRLKSIYDNLVKNKYFLQNMKDLDYELKFIKDDLYVFRRIK